MRQIVFFIGIPPEYGIVNGHLQVGSPGIDAAVRIPGINDNYFGTGPDMGMFVCTSPGQFLGHIKNLFEKYSSSFLIPEGWHVCRRKTPSRASHDPL
jgi:hypothetical protein